MQTFLPYKSYRKTMGCLDYRRLGKQRVEARQILRTLVGESRGWRNHPAVLMWRGREPQLRAYLREAIEEWVRRGYRNTMRIPAARRCSWAPPRWLTPRVIRAYRSNLVRKDRKYYGKFRWGVRAGLPYAWPVSIKERRP